MNSCGIKKQGQAPPPVRHPPPKTADCPSAGFARRIRSKYDDLYQQAEKETP